MDGGSFLLSLSFVTSVDVTNVLLRELYVTYGQAYCLFQSTFWATNLKAGWVERGSDGRKPCPASGYYGGLEA